MSPSCWPVRGSKLHFVVVPAAPLTLLSSSPVNRRAPLRPSTRLSIWFDICFSFRFFGKTPSGATLRRPRLWYCDRVKMGIHPAMSLASPALLLIRLLYPQLALWARRMSPASPAGGIQESCGQGIRSHLINAITGMKRYLGG